MKGHHRILIAVVLVMTAVSCSTTRVLQDDQYRLVKNRIEVTNDEEFNTGKLATYIEQKPSGTLLFGWNPFMSIYNWSNGKGKGWDKFVHKIGTAPMVFEQDKVDKSLANIENHLEYLGYYGSDVMSIVNARKKKVDVTYRITLGKRFPIKNVTLTLPENGEFGADFLKDTTALTIKEGDYLSEAALEAEAERSSTIMRDKGFYTFNKNYYFFEADTLTDPGYALLNLTINEYTRNQSPRDAQTLRKFYINDVTISYPKTLKFREKVLRELNTIVPGELYNENVINATYSRFSAVRVFNSVNIGMTQVDTNLVDCSINLTQSKLQGFKVNFEASSNSSGLFGISPQVSYYHKNVFRGGEWLNLSFMGNFQFKFNDDVRSNELGASAGLSFPKFFPFSYKAFKGAIPRTEINAAYNYQNRPEYTRNVLSTSLGYSGTVKDKFIYQVYPLQLNIVKLFDLDSDFYNTLANDPFLKNAYQDHFDLGSGATLYYTTNTESIPSESYRYARLQFDIAGNLLSAFNGLMRKDGNGSRMIWNTPYSQFVRAEMTLGRTWVFGANSGQSIATRLLAGAGYAYGNSTALPFEKHFYGGGASSLRGWQTRTVGPGLAKRDDSFIIPNQTGDMKLEANIEYRFNMFWKVAGAVFVDVGNIWTLRSSGAGNSEESMFRWNTFGESLAANWGIGGRLNLGFLLVRVDMGIKIHDPAREQKWLTPEQWLKRDGYAFHFGVGYPF